MPNGKIIFKRLAFVLGAVAFVWVGAASFIFLPYYNWKFAKTHGFVEWVVFGELAASFKAYGWPYYVFLSSDQSVEKTGSAQHEIAAIEYHNKSVHLQHAALAKTSNGDTLSDLDRDEIVEYQRKALAEAERANIFEMNESYPGYGDHFMNEFMKGLKLVIENFPSRTTEAEAALAHGVELKNRFGDWYSANLDGIRGTKKSP